MEMASEREWFDETLFVIFGDHGRAITTDFAVPESLNHVPLLFYSPKHIAPEVRSDLVAQMDIAPTAISMLGREFNNHTMGIDLTRQSRSMIPYTADGYIAARDREWLYIYDLATEQPLLYDLTAEGDARLENRAAEFPERVYSMHSYVAATAQASSDMHNAVGAWSNWMIESVE
jgi:arylsulfatase A-like enzyme